MTRLNNKGFAVSTILYGMLSLIIIILMLIFGLMRANKNFNESLVDSLTTSMNSCAMLEAKLENCLFNNGSCDAFKEKYKECLNNPEVNTPNGDTELTQIDCNKTEYQELLTCRILNDNNEQEDTNIDFSLPSSSTNGKGLYYTSTNTEDIDGDGTGEGVYYFRGTVNNNYVKFIKNVGVKGTCEWESNEVFFQDGDEFVSVSKEQCGANVCYSSEGYIILDDYNECTGEDYMGESSWVETPITEEMNWRIVRINEDGSVRLVYNDNLSEYEGKTAFSSKPSIEEGYSNAHVGYMYGEPNSSSYDEEHKNTKNSAIKNKIDQWYVSNLKDDYGQYIADAGFCNDRSVAKTENTWESDDKALGYGNENTTYYGAYDRIVNKNQPQFACPNAMNDLFTTSTSSKGNKALTYPIGLMTADEYIYAGGAYLKKSSTYIKGGENFYTITPYQFEYRFSYGDIKRPIVFYVSYQYISNYLFGPNDNDGFDDIQYQKYALPVINLKKVVKVSLENTGDPGTANNPYILRID